MQDDGNSSPGERLFDVDVVLQPIRVKILRWVCLLGLATGLVSLASGLVRHQSPAVVLGWGLSVTVWITVLALQSRRPRAAAALHSVAIVGVFLGLASARGGFDFPPNASVFVLLPVIAGFTWSSKGAYVVAALAVLDLVVLVRADVHLSLTQQVLAVGEFTIQVVVVSLIVQVALRALGKSARSAIEHELRFRETIESSPDAIVVLDRHDMTLELFNPRARALSGLTSDDVRGKRLEHLGWLPDEAIARLRGRLEQWREGEMLAPFELDTNRPGQLLEVNVSGFGSRSNRDSWLLNIRDVSDRRSAELVKAAFEEQIRQSKSLETVGRLAGGVAHDFNNLLTVIFGAAEMLRHEVGSEANLAEDVDAIMDAATRAAALTSQLLAVARRQVLEPQTLQPNDVLRRLLPLLQRLVPESIRLEQSLGPAVGEIRVDESRLEQVIVNLVANARDAMPNGGALTIETSNEHLGGDDVRHWRDVVPGEYVQIAVRDTGEGMSPETAARVFEPFFSTKGAKGTGLGLATAHGIVRQSGGYIHVDSHEGRGSSFYVCFPRREPAPSASSKRVRPAVVSPHLRVLLVEDDDRVRHAVKRMLLELGHEVTDVASAQQAIESHDGATKPYQLLLTDVVMPGGSGREIADELSRRDPAMVVLFMSGYTDDAIAHQGVLEEGRELLSKPFTIDDLRRKLGLLFDVPTCLIAGPCEV